MHIARGRTAENQVSLSLPYCGSKDDAFNLDLDRLNREELATALEDCVFLVGRVDTLAGQVDLSSRHRRQLVRFCRRLATAVGALDDRLLEAPPDAE